MHSPGDPIHYVIRKWDGRRHWEYSGIHLGTDDHGTWVGFPPGTHYARPGREYVESRPHVGLIPAGAAWHLATFYATPGGKPWPGLDSHVEVYVDMTTPAEVTGDTLRAVDLDLDVVRGFNGRVVVDDEDEFAEHQVRLAYPPDVIAAARDSCDQVLAAARAAEAPYDGTHGRWVAELARLTAP